MCGDEYFLAPMSTALVALLLAVAAALVVLVERRRTHRFDVGQVSEGWLIARRAQDVVEIEPRIRS